MDYSPCPKREIWLFLKGNHISKTGGAMPTKIGVHARDVNPYLHEFFWADSDLLNFFHFMNHKQTGETTPIKIGVHRCDINLYLHIFFEPIPID